MRAERERRPINRCWRANTDAQNFTCGGDCALSAAVNSAIGLFPEKAVFAHSNVGNVRNDVLYVRTASM